MSDTYERDEREPTHDRNAVTAEEGAEQGAAGGEPVNPHKAAILEDIGNRSTWATKDAEILKRRMGKRKKRKTKPYPGAPNGVVPIVDDVTRDKTDQEISMVCNAPLYANAIVLRQGVPAELRAQLEMAFDTYLRHIIHLRAKLEEFTDAKNARGFGVMKTVRTTDPRWGEVPDCEALDLRDVVVPTQCRDVQRAERVTHILRLSPRELRDRAERKKWQNVERVIRAAASEDRGTGDTEEADALSETAQLVGITTSGQHSKTVVVWEHYHYAVRWDVEHARGRPLAVGERCVTVFAPDAPEWPLSVYPWREEDTLEPPEGEELAAEVAAAAAKGRDPERARLVKGPARPWPFVQGRFENRSRYYYDSRGVGQLVMDEQIFATGSLNAKQTMLDYYQQPLLEGGTPNSGNISFEPGSFLPEGVKFAQPPPVPPQFDFDVDQHRRVASQRCNGGAHLWSGEMARTRKVQKTATEVAEESAQQGMASSASVDRANDPLAELYQQLWDDLRRMQKPLPIIAYGDYLGETTAQVYGLPVLWVPASSAKTLNPEMQRRRGQEVLAFLTQYKDVAPIRFVEALRDVVAHWDPVRAHRWLGDPNQAEGQQPPIYQVLQALQQQVSQLGEAGRGIHEQLEEFQKVLRQVGTLANQNANALRRQKEGAVT